MTASKHPPKGKSLPRLAMVMVAIGVAGCAAPESGIQTLAELDQPAASRPVTSKRPAAGSNETAKQAYYRYIRTAPEDDKGRNMALARLADLELAESHRLVEQNDYQDDERYQQTLIRTIELLSKALNEYPDADGNDQKLYQLAKSYDQLGRFEETQEALVQLVRQHPSSSLYPEAQFRLAETAFSQGDYMAAEVAYTAALTSSRDTNFHERALFKRGWARYRQALFEQALDDFIAVIHAQGFARDEAVAEDQKTVYAEYYRSLALTMVNSPNPKQLPAQFERQGMNELFPAYHAASNILAKQGRFSDAVEQWQLFLQTQPNGWPAIVAQANIVSLWREGKFHQRALTATEALHQDYQRQQALLEKSQSRHTTPALAALRQHWNEAAQAHHAEYQESGEARHFAQAQTWYQRYLEHFDGYAQQDGIALAYGDLLAETDNTEAAFQQYERAAFDGRLILNPEAAYAAIALLSEMVEDQDGAWLDKYINYTAAFAQLYPMDERTPTMALTAAQVAFNQKQFPGATQLLELALPQASGRTQQQAQLLLIQSHLEAHAYTEAERTSGQLLAIAELPNDVQQQARELRALSVYRQAEASEQTQDWAQAIDHYRRIHELDPESDNAATGLYNAIALSAEQEQWTQSIALMERFKQRYPEHQYRADVERKLTQAYVVTGQTDQAARQYEQLAQSEQDVAAQREALWKAAEIYDDKEDLSQAIDAYRRYAHSYPDPYPQQAEAMNKLIGFYQLTNETEKRQFWERRLLRTDRNQSDNQKSRRTSLLAARAALSLGQNAFEQFEGTRLSLPLDQSLARKTEHMQEAIQNFAATASYGFAELSSEATHRIGRIYETLARDLLDSDRPPELSDEELVQYDILLEDRAFPFEDRAIEFYERNLKRAQQEGFNDWMVDSRDRLEILFPVRYARKPKAGLYIGEADKQNIGEADKRDISEADTRDNSEADSAGINPDISRIEPPAAETVDSSPNT